MIVGVLWCPHIWPHTRPQFSRCPQSWCPQCHWLTSARTVIWVDLSLRCPLQIQWKRHSQSPVVLRLVILMSLQQGHPAYGGCPRVSGQVTISQTSRDIHHKSWRQRRQKGAWWDDVILFFTLLSPDTYLRCRTERLTRKLQSLQQLGFTQYPHLIIWYIYLYSYTDTIQSVSVESES